MHSTFTVDLLGVRRRRNFFTGGSRGTGDSLLLLPLVVGVAVLVEASLLVRELYSLAAEEELQQLSETVVAGSDELLTSTIMRLCNLATRIDCVRTVPRSERGQISQDAAESSARFDTTFTLFSCSRLVLHVPLTALPFRRSLASSFRCFLVRKWFTFTPA